MAISKTEDLFRLIKSLTKSEKRTFRLFAERIKSSNELLYMQLFDIMDKQKKLDERSIHYKLGNFSPVKYSNAKRHLYDQILTSLRMLNKSKRSNIQLREYIDFVHILYGKGFYLQALKVLQKAKKLAKEHHHDFNLITIIELEKLIHSRHITRRESEFIEELTGEALEKISTLYSRIKLSNLKMLLHRFYIEKGHVKNAEEEKKVSDFFQEQIPSLTDISLGQMERILLYQSHVWYYYILNDFENCHKYALQWIQVFKEYDELKTRDINLFLRGFHYLLTCSYNLKRQKTYAHYHNELHYELENYNFLPSLIRNYSSFFTKKNLDNKVQTCFLQFFKAIINTPILERKTVMTKYLNDLLVLESNQYEKRAFLYLDCISWLKSKIERRTVGEIIRERTME